MSSDGKELEVKFFVNDLPRVEKRLQESGATLIQPRVYEINLRYDTPDRLFSKSHNVLRLRNDTQTRLTYKGPGQIYQGARLRRELEISVSDFETTQKFLEALGYQVTVTYEKFRSVYRIERTVVALDELPYGNFVEIEGEDGVGIQETARRVGLDFKARILDSYLVLFEKVLKRRGFSFRDLTFENFSTLDISQSDLGVYPADYS
jgi:adenylate cyclase, class 2